MKKHISYFGQLVRNFVLVFAIGLSVGLTSGTASNFGDEDKLPLPKLTLEELDLANELDIEPAFTIESVLASLEEKVEKVLVYDTEGNLLQTQEGDIDFNQIPLNASLMMTDGHTQYFVLIE